jgi:hypothetical protein
MASSLQRLTTTPVMSGGVYGVAISDNSEVIYIGASNLARGYKSTDQGATWTMLPQVGGGAYTWNGVCTSALGDIVFASVNKSIYKSTDYGATWTSIHTSTKLVYLAGCSSDGNILYFYSTSDYIYKKVGANAATQTATPKATLYGPSLSCSNDGSVVAFSDGGSTDYIYVSKDGGATWTSIDTGITHKYWDVRVVRDGSKVYARGVNYFVRINTTGTPTLIDIENKNGKTFGSITSSHDGLIVLGIATDNTFMKSVDYGQTFTLDATSITEFNGGVLANKMADRAVLAGSNGTAPLTSVIYMYTGTGSDVLAATAPCFLADARVQTPSGPRAIADIQEGDLVLSVAGKPVRVQRVVAKTVKPTIQSVPYIIPVGRWGAQVDLPISPDHRVVVPHRGLVKASKLGLDRLIMKEPFTYYNLEVENCENIIVEGVAVESLAHTKQYTLSMTEFAALIVRLERSGKGALAAKLLTKAQQHGANVRLPLYLQRK